jgi:hypothetical protein
MVTWLTRFFVVLGLLFANYGTQAVAKSANMCQVCLYADDIGLFCDKAQPGEDGQRTCIPLQGTGYCIGTIGDCYPDLN